MSIGSNVLSILNLARNISANVQAILGIVQSFSPADVENKLTAIDGKLDLLIQTTSGPETGFFIPQPKDPMIMSMFQMTVGDLPHTSKLTFSEPGAPADGAVMSDNPGLATITLDPTDHATWTITLVDGGGPAQGAPPMVANMSYTGTSDPPDSGPVQVEGLVLTVVPMPTAETGQFNP